jgi:hypothetical protein
LHIKAVGSPATACRGLECFTERTQADELIAMTYAHDPALTDLVRYAATSWKAKVYFYRHGMDHKDQSMQEASTMSFTTSLGCMLCVKQSIP